MISSTVDQALMIMLRESPNIGAMAASLLGAMLWGKDRKGRVIAQQGGGDYAAQMLLGRMKKAGLVRTLSGAGSSRWELTADGVQRAVRTGQDSLLARAKVDHDAGKPRTATRAQLDGVTRAAKAIAKLAEDRCPLGGCGVVLEDWWKFCPGCGSYCGTASSGTRALRLLPIGASSK